MDQGKSIGRYSPGPSIQQNINQLQKWQKDQETTISWISSFYRERFENLAPMLFELTTVEALLANIPDLSETEFKNLESNVAGFTSNLTYTTNGFYNTIHKDNDAQTYAYGIWAPISTTIGDLIDCKDSFTCTGGEFILPSYKCFIDFSSCAGTVEVIWRSNMDYHCTIPLKIDSRFDRIGSSCQINKSLVDRIRNLVVEKRNGKNVDQKIRGVQEIISQKLQKFC